MEFMSRYRFSDARFLQEITFRGIWKNFPRFRSYLYVYIGGGFARRQAESCNSDVHASKDKCPHAHEAAVSWS